MHIHADVGNQRQLQQHTYCWQSEAATTTYIHVDAGNHRQLQQHALVNSNISLVQMKNMTTVSEDSCHSLAVGL